MGKKRLMQQLEFEVKIRQVVIENRRQIKISEDYLKRMQRTRPARVLGALQPLEVRASQTTYPAPRLSMMPYALVMSAMSVGLLFLIRLFVAGSLSLNVFLLSGVGVVGLGLACCAYVAVRSWRAAEGLRQWQMQLETRREWSWE
jgi:hypothetical protein